MIDDLYTVRPTCVAEIREVAAPLLKAHWEELATDRARMVLDPDWDAYERCERGGSLAAFAALHDGVLVGYSASFVLPGHLHYRGLPVVNNDVLFVHPSHRRGAGRMLIEITEELARKAGALMLWHAKPGTAMDRLLSSRDGYRVQDIIYSKGF